MKRLQTFDVGFIQDSEFQCRPTSLITYQHIWGRDHRLLAKVLRTPFYTARCSPARELEFPPMTFGINQGSPMDLLLNDGVNSVGVFSKPL